MVVSSLQGMWRCGKGISEVLGIPKTRIPCVSGDRETVVSRLQGIQGLSWVFDTQERTKHRYGDVARGCPRYPLALGIP